MENCEGQKDMMLNCWLWFQPTTSQMPFKSFESGSCVSILVLLLSIMGVLLAGLYSSLGGILFKTNLLLCFYQFSALISIHYETEQC